MLTKKKSRFSPGFFLFSKAVLRQVLAYKLGHLKHRDGFSFRQKLF